MRFCHRVLVLSLYCAFLIRNVSEYGINAQKKSDIILCRNGRSVSGCLREPTGWLVHEEIKDDTNKSCLVLLSLLSYYHHWTDSTNVDTLHTTCNSGNRIGQRVS